MAHIADVRVDEDGTLHLYDASGNLLGSGPNALKAVAAMYRQSGEVHRERGQMPGVYRMENGKWGVKVRNVWVGFFATMREADEVAERARIEARIQKQGRPRKVRDANSA